MSEIETFGDESQGHKFDIFVKEHQNGFTYELKIHGHGAGIPKVASSDELFDSLDKARQVARMQAWELIRQIVQNSAQ